MQTTNRFWKSIGQFAPWLIIFAAGFVLRIWQLPDQLLADDEWHAVHKLIRSDFSSIFTSFGHADHSIPLTLYYKALTLTTGLTEWAMRLPLLLAGLLSLVFIPWLLRETLRLSERMTLACLLAFSPILVYFSRTARPYGLSVLLAFTALFAFYRWWTERGFKWGTTYVVTATLAAWLHPVTLALTLTPFVFFGATAVWEGISKREFQKVLRISLIGLATLAVLLLLLGMPIFHDYSSLLLKSGIHAVSLRSLWATLSLFIGSANIFVIVSWILLALVGFRVLVSRQPLLAYYFATSILVASLVVISTSAEWINHPLVLARYLLPNLLILLLLVSLGIVYLLHIFSPTLQFSLITLAVLFYYLTGPLPEQYHQGLNQFTGHMSYQYDYDKERNVYYRHFRLPENDIPVFYQQLAELPADSVTLIVAPWYLEWHWNSWHLYQKVHRQRILAGFVIGLCTENTFGEYPPGQAGINFTNIIHLSELAKGQTVAADYLVYQRDMAFQPSPDARPGLDLEQCEHQIETLFGPPMIDDGKMLVYRLPERPATD